MAYLTAEPRGVVVSFPGLRDAAVWLLDEMTYTAVAVDDAIRNRFAVLDVREGTAMLEMLSYAVTAVNGRVIPVRPWVALHPPPQRRLAQRQDLSRVLDI